MPVDFKGKNACAALFDALTAAGCPVSILDGVAVTNDEAAAQAVIDAFTLANAKAARCAEVSEYSGRVRDRLMGYKSPYEVGSWPLKALEARAWQSSGDPAQAPMLVQESTRRGIPMSALVTKVLNNATAFQALEAVCAGIDGNHRDAINAITPESAGSEAEAFAAVAAYDITAGWPSPA